MTTMRRSIGLVAAGWLIMAMPAQSASCEPARSAELVQRATGTFEVTMRPQGEPQTHRGLAIMPYLNEKRFIGDLEGTSRGEMVMATTPTGGSAGYVLLERVDGVLAGRRGSFILQHSSIVARGEERQSIVVLPDSGTDGLVGLSGEMTVEVSSGQHRYVFRYVLPE